MGIRYTLCLIGLSLIAIVGIIMVAYGIDVTVMEVSNSIFIVGLCIFFIGVIQLSGAVQIFDSTRYLNRRVFGRSNGQDFRSLGEYKTYMGQKSTSSNTRTKGFTLFGLGSMYVVISFMMELL